MKKRRILWVLGFLLLAGAGVSTALFLANRRDLTTSSQAAYDAFKEATLNRNRFYFKEARVGFAKALELDPNFAMAMLSMADIAGDREQAETLVRRAARQRDRLTEIERYHVDIASANIDGKFDEAVRLARELNAKHPEDALGAGYLAKAAQLSGNPEQGIKIYESLLAVDPNNAEAYNQIGYYYGYRGEYEKAIDNLTRYQFISPDNANPFDSLGENQAYSGRYNEAIENLNRALAIKADFAPAYLHLGVAYEGLGDYAKAIQSYEKAAELDDTNAMRREYLMQAIRAALYARDREGVRTLIERISKVPVDAKNDPKNIAGAVLTVLGDLADGQGAQAERRLKELRPTLEARWAQYQQDGKIPKNLKPHFREWNLMMARALEMQGRTDEALAFYELNANPPNPYEDFTDRRFIMEARAKVAEIVARRGDLDRAEKLIAENRKWNPSWAPCRPAETAVAEMRRAKVLAASK